MLKICTELIKKDIYLHMIDIFKNIVHNENILPNLIESGVLKINESILVKGSIPALLAMFMIYIF